MSHTGKNEKISGWQNQYSRLLFSSPCRQIGCVSKIWDCIKVTLGMIIFCSIFIDIARKFWNHKSAVYIWAASWQNQQNGMCTGIRPVWSESSLSAWRKLGSLAPYLAHIEDWSDWADAGRTLILLVLSCRSSNHKFSLHSGLNQVNAHQLHLDAKCVHTC